MSKLALGKNKGFLFTGKLDIKKKETKEMLHMEHSVGCC
jgi:hypothetical protein